MTLQQLYYLMLLAKASNYLLFIIVIINLLIIACVSLIEVKTDKDKRITTKAVYVSLFLISICFFIPGNKDLVVMFGGSYYTNGPATKITDPVVNAAIHKFLTEYEDTQVTKK